MVRDCGSRNSETLVTKVYNFSVTARIEEDRPVLLSVWSRSEVLHGWTIDPNRQPLDWEDWGSGVWAAICGDAKVRIVRRVIDEPMTVRERWGKE